VPRQSCALTASALTAVRTAPPPEVVDRGSSVTSGSSATKRERLDREAQALEQRDAALTASDEATRLRDDAERAKAARPRARHASFHPW
jgi:hypothetical protein